MQLQNFYAQDVNGNIVPGAECTLFIGGTSTLATGLEDVDGNPLTNPFNANDIGLASVSAPQGIYDLQIARGFINNKIRIQFIDAAQVASDATAAAVSAASAAASASSTVVLVSRFLAANAADPTTRDNGSPLQPGDTYFNTVVNRQKVYSGSSWSSQVSSSELSASTGSSLVGAGIRTQASKNLDVISVRDYITTAIDGTTSNQSGIVAAVNAAFSSGFDLLWPQGSYVSTSTIPNFWDVNHIGPGTLNASSTIFYFSQFGNLTNKVYVSPGATGGDGLSSSRPLGGIQIAVDALAKKNKLLGRWQIFGAAGTYTESVRIPDGLAQGQNYLEFKFPSAPGVRTDPDSWPVGGATLDGTGSSASVGFDTGRYNKVYIEYLRVSNFYDSGLSSTNQVKRAVAVDKFSFLFTYGCSYVGNGLANLSVLPDGSGYVVGGHLKGSRYSMDNTAGRLSLSADAATYTVIDGGLEYGLYQKHQSSTVLDYTEFRDCGKVAGAAAYGAAIFAYKPNASVDTRGCKYYRNNIVRNVRGGMVADNPGIPDVFGSGADANTRIWLIKGFGADDLINYRSQAGRDITTAFGGGTVTGATTSLILNTGATVPAGYLVGVDQRVHVVIYASNNAGGTAQVRPSFVTPGGTRYEMGSFQVAASANAKIELDIFVSSNGTITSSYYGNIGATTGGTSTGQIITNPVAFDASDMTFQVWGDTSSTNILTIRKALCELWG